MKKLISLLVLSLAFSAQAVTLKVGLVAPEGTNWSKNLKKMAKEIKKATQKRVKLKIYFGGSQGDEPDMLRKIRVGQLHGGVFTGKTLGDINGDVRVVEIPFTFDGDTKKAMKSVQTLAPFFNQGFSKQKFVNLGFFEIGNVYFISQNKAPTVESLKGVKIWSWEGDQLVNQMIEELSLVSVPLSLPDVLSSLSSGIVQAAYAPPLGILALQWNTKVKYLIDYPLAFSVGAFLVSDKAWKKVKPEDKKIVLEISKKYIDKVNLANNGDNLEALKAMKASGMEFMEFSAEDTKKVRSVRGAIISKLIGKVFSKEALNRLEKSLK